VARIAVHIATRQVAISWLRTAVHIATGHLAISWLRTAVHIATRHLAISRLETEMHADTTHCYFTFMNWTCAYPEILFLSFRKFEVWQKPYSSLFYVNVYPISFYMQSSL